jgi:hypothetical protein
MTPIDKFVDILKPLLLAECGIELTTEEASILTNTLTDFFEALALIEHKKDCPRKERLEEYLRQRWGGKRKINITINHHDNNN